MTQIKIWEDNWIPGSHNLKIQTVRGNNLVTTVDELINPINSTWDEELLKTIFWPTDVYRIMQIPIRSGREDLVAWQYNRSGIFFSQICISLPMGIQIWGKKYSSAAEYCIKKSALEEFMEIEGPCKD